MNEETLVLFKMMLKSIPECRVTDLKYDREFEDLDILFSNGSVITIETNNDYDEFDIAVHVLVYAMEDCSAYSIQRKHGGYYYTGRLVENGQNNKS